MFLEIAIDTPLRRTFDYRCPASVDCAALRPGVRVAVPFGRRRVIGIFLRARAHSDIPAAKLKTAIEVLDAEPIIESALFDLLLWAAEYYRHPIGEVLASALPVAVRAGAPAKEVFERWQLNEEGLLQWDTLPTRSTRLRAMAKALITPRTAIELCDVHEDWRGALRELEKRGWVQCEISSAHESGLPDVPERAPADQPVLTEEQRHAVNQITNAADSFRTFLLQGVTGSGKTEVYLRVIESVVRAGKQALVLVPEIALTPQLLARFSARFAVPMAVLHSGLNDSERLTAWRWAREGVAPIVIGTRSAIFASLQAPGIVIVDEEHDPSYKQQEGFRYSARDLAIARAQRHGIPVVLGSATPSLESLARVKKQPEDLLLLANRAGNAQPPRVRTIDLRQFAQTEGIATPTMLAMEQHLKAGGQILLYLNRRGYAPVLFCPSCGWSAACKRCDARMTVHRSIDKLICHHCGNEEKIPELCASCHAPAKPVGEGTERIESTVARLFPAYNVARIDRDRIRRKGELESALEQIHCGAARILIGTQMLTKGHHFPDVTLVVVLNADQGLFGIDFRAGERLAQNIVQVAGRAGRAERAGEVLIQTEYPQHPLLTTLVTKGYAEFAEQALSEREHAHWPPYARIALLRAEANSMGAAMAFLGAAREQAKARRVANVHILGPVSAPMARRAGRYRAQLLLQAPSHGPLQKLLAPWVPALASLVEAKRVRWSIDVDPAELF